MTNITHQLYKIKIENLILPADLAGETGINRSVTRPLINASNDVDAIQAWLSQFNKKTTYETYRKESERLLLWAVMQHGKAFSSLLHEDMVEYENFLLDPRPFERWVMTGKKVARSHPEWRPFAGPLSPTSLRHSISILKSLFSWLVHANYIAGNPLALSKLKRPSLKPRFTRFLDEDLWNEVKTTIESLPRETSREREHYVRSRWIFSLVYITGMRISEVSRNAMGRFFYRKNQKEEALWWLEVIGKGDKTRIVPATIELMNELARYRREMGFQAIPIEGETIPLVLPIGGQQRSMSRGGIHNVIKKVFILTSERIEMRGPDYANQVIRLRAASTHWLRHTAGSHMATKMDLRSVRDNLGHESITTTNKYLHKEDDKRHSETEQDHKINW